MSDFLKYLFELVEDASAPLPGVSHKRMFGCEAFFAEGTIYALIWKDDRIGLKLPDEASHAALAAMPGTTPWAPGGKRMGKWLLVPEGFHDDRAELAAWVRRAHAQALTAGPKPTKKQAVKS